MYGLVCKGQPLVCDICSSNHKAMNCPLRAKCLRCHQAGHFIRDFPQPVWFMPGREDAPSLAPLMAPPSGGVCASIKDPVVASDDVVEVPESQASQSVLCEGWLLPPPNSRGFFFSFFIFTILLIIKNNTYITYNTIYYPTNNTGIYTNNMYKNN